MIKLPESITPVNLLWYAIAAIPLAIRVPFLFRTWYLSPSDRFDIVFWFGAAAFLWFNRETLWAKPRETLSGRIGGALLVIFAAAAIMLSLTRQINIAGIFGGITLLAGLWLFRRGEHAFGLVLPAFILMGFGTPSTTYWIDCLGDFTYPLTGFFIKLAASFLVLALWHLRHHLSLQTSCFICAIAAVVFIAVSSTTTAPQGPPLNLNPDFKKSVWVSSEVPLTLTQQLYFADTEKIILRTYYPIDGQTPPIGLLAILPGSNIHAIHPARFCAASDGDHPNSVRQRVLTFNGQEFPVEELLITTQSGQNVLMWNWYTGPDFTTADFKTFRIKWSSKENWCHYQLKTRMTASDPEAETAARKRLTEFIQSAMQ